MKFLGILSFSAILLAPLAAQKMGSVNANAPTLESRITFHDGASLAVVHTAITWAEGRTMRAVSDPERGERTRAFLNQRAARSPLGRATVTGDLRIGARRIEPGSYDLYFTIDEDLKWHMVLARRGEKGEQGVKHDFPLALRKVDAHHQRLQIRIDPGEGDKDAVLTVQFGNLSARLVAGAPRAEKKPTSRRSG